MKNNNHIFYCQKDDWKQEISTNKVKMPSFLEASQWSKSRNEIDKFWNALEKEKIAKNDYDFSNFIFPPVFHRNSFLDQGKTPFKGNVKFNNAQFLGSITFRKEEFLGKVDFSHTIFKGKVNFDESIFEDELIFDYSIFEKGLKLSGSFENKVRFKKCEYFTSMSFKKTTFGGSFLFQENFSINSSLFENYSYRQILAVVKQLRHTGDFSNKKIKEAINSIEGFDGYDLNKVKKLVNVVRKERHFNNAAGLFFDLVDFGKKSVIKRVRLTNVSFIGTNLEEVKFNACKWNDSGRLIINDENRISLFGYRPYNLRQKNIELSYRQLRLNFEKSKDWELSGKAYQSEMLHRKSRLLHQGKLLDYGIYSIYHFYGFNHSITAPIKIFLFTTFLLFPVLYFEVVDLFFWNGIKTSLANTLPFVSFKHSEVFFNESALWWISNIQYLISIISLTFLILSLRNRFR